MVQIKAYKVGLRLSVGVAYVYPSASTLMVAFLDRASHNRELSSMSITNYNNLPSNVRPTTRDRSGNKIIKELSRGSKIRHWSQLLVSVRVDR